MNDDGRLSARFGNVFRDPTDGEVVMILCPDGAYDGAYAGQGIVMGVLVIVPSRHHPGRYPAGTVTTEARLTRWERAS